MLSTTGYKALNAVVGYLKYLVDELTAQMGTFI